MLVESTSTITVLSIEMKWAKAWQNSGMVLYGGVVFSVVEWPLLVWLTGWRQLKKANHWPAIGDNAVLLLCAVCMLEFSQSYEKQAKLETYMLKMVISP